MRERHFPRWAGVGAGGALLLSFMAAGQASAVAPATDPAPSCVTVYESWRYTQVENTCAETMSLQVVYEDGAVGPCHTVGSGDVTTIGEGYLGLHGHVHHVAVCPAPVSATGVAPVG
ncbi:hypothetical protein SUDANB132_00488 [Streptomyces sp. enrichment culture]